MATQTIITITDDLDGSVDAETIRFAFQGQPFEIDLAAKNLEKLQRALQPYINAARTPGSQRSATRARRSRSAGGAAAKTDYTDTNHFGQLHRGRVTEEEAALVRSNLAQANKNRAASNQPEIDPKDPKEKSRYGL
jgi:hypothetical protein